MPSRPGVWDHDMYCWNSGYGGFRLCFSCFSSPCSTICILAALGLVAKDDTPVVTSQCDEAAWPTDDKDLSGSNVNAYVLGFAPRFIIVMKGVNNVNANEDAWLNCSLVPEAQYFATISNARLELMVAPQVKDEYLPDSRR